MIVGYKGYKVWMTLTGLYGKGIRSMVQWIFSHKLGTRYQAAKTCTHCILNSIHAAQ